MTGPIDAAARERRDSEAALMALVRDGDERALETLHARYAVPLYSLALQVTRSDRSAQDVVQEIFVAVWKDAGRSDQAMGSLSSWWAIPRSGPRVSGPG